MLQVNGWFKIAEEDNWENGCSLDSSTAFDGRDNFHAETETELIEKLMAFTGETEKQNVLINSCDEDGRLDIQVYENENGERASEREMELFKKNECRIWLATYTFQVSQCSTFAFSQGMPEYSY